MGFGQSAFVKITLESQGKDAIDAFESAVVEHDEIVECYLMSGEYDYLLHIIVRDSNAYEAIHRRVLTTLPRVARLTSSFALRTVRGQHPLPL